MSLAKVMKSWISAVYYILLISVSVLVMTSQNLGCEHEHVSMTDPEGILESTGFPASYTPGFNATWLVNVSQFYGVQFAVDTFFTRIGEYKNDSDVMQFYSSCQTDGAAIRELSGFVLGSEKITVYKGIVTVQFRSVSTPITSAMTSLRFRIRYRAFGNNNCSQVVRPANGYVYGSDFRVGKSVTFACEDGYSLSGLDTIECLLSVPGDPEWSASQNPSCDTPCRAFAEQDTAMPQVNETRQEPEVIVLYGSRILSPSYPQIFSGNISCRWLVKVHPHQTTIISLEDLQIESQIFSLEIRVNDTVMLKYSNVTGLTLPFTLSTITSGDIILTLDLYGRNNSGLFSLAVIRSMNSEQPISRTEFPYVPNNVTHPLDFTSKYVCQSDTSSYIVDSNNLFTLEGLKSTFDNIYPISILSELLHLSELSGTLHYQTETMYHTSLTVVNEERIKADIVSATPEIFPSASILEDSFGHYHLKIFHYTSTLVNAELFTSGTFSTSTLPHPSVDLESLYGTHYSLSDTIPSSITHHVTGYALSDSITSPSTDHSHLRTKLQASLDQGLIHPTRQAETLLYTVTSPDPWPETQSPDMILSEPQFETRLSEVISSRPVSVTPWYEIISSHSLSEMPPYEIPSSVPLLQTPSYEIPSSVPLLQTPSHEITSSFRLFQTPSHEITSSFRLFQTPSHEIASSFQMLQTRSHEITSSVRQLHMPSSSQASQIISIESHTDCATINASSSITVVGESLAFSTDNDTVTSQGHIPYNKTEDTLPSNGLNAGALAVGIISSVSVGVAIGVVVYLYYRRKIFVARQYIPKFSNPVYDHETSSTASTLTLVRTEENTRTLVMTEETNTPSL